jgi:hypothetical protein
MVIFTDQNQNPQSGSLIVDDEHVGSFFFLNRGKLVRNNLVSAWNPVAATSFGSDVKYGAVTNVNRAPSQDHPALPPMTAESVVFSDLDAVDKLDPNKIWCITGGNTGWCGPASRRWIAAPFEVSQAVTLSSIELALGTPPGKNDEGQKDVLINLLGSTISGRPDAVLESWAVLSLPEHVIKAVKSRGTLLQAGHRYWLEVIGAGDKTMVMWYKNTHGAEGGMLNLNDSGWSPFQNDQTRPAFTVIGVPRP